MSDDKEKLSIRKQRLAASKKSPVAGFSSTEDFIAAVQHQPRLLEHYSKYPDPSVRQLLEEGFAPAGNVPYIKAFPGMDLEVRSEIFTIRADLFIHDMAHFLVNALHTPGLAGEIKVGLQSMG